MRMALLGGILLATANRDQRIKIASGETSGIYYPLAGGFAKIWNDNLGHARLSVQTSKGSADNIYLLTARKADIVFSQSDVAYNAHTGQGPYAGYPVKIIRALMSMYPEAVQIIASTNIKTIDDLAGKKVSVGVKEGGIEFNAIQVLDAAGMSFNDILPQNLSLTETINSLKSGHIDAAFVTAGAALPSVRDLSTQFDMSLIGLEADVIQELTYNPIYTRMTIPAGTYAGVKEDVQTVAVESMLVVREDLDESLATKMLEVVFAHLNVLNNASEQAKHITRDRASKTSITLHQGAIDFFNR